MRPQRNRTLAFYLHLAVTQNNVTSVKYYLDCGASATYLNNMGRSALAVAVHERKRDIVNVLLTYCQTSRYEPQTGLSFCHVACMLDNYEVVERFLRNGAVVNHQVGSIDRGKRERENWRGWPVRAEPYFDSEPLLRHGPADDKWAHYTPLHFATENRAMHVMNLLIKYRANVNAKDARGNTPLHLACALDNPMVIVQILLTAGADPNMQNMKGAMPAHVAIEQQNLDLLKILVTYGARLDRPMWGALNLTCLHLACQVKNTAIMEFVIQNKVNINAADWTGGTALHALIDVVPEEAYSSLKQYKKALDILDSAGVKLNQQDHLGHTALHRAISQTHPIMTRLLLEQGASMILKDRYGHSPIWYVIQSHCQDMHDIINEHIEKMRLVWPRTNSLYYGLPMREEMTPKRVQLIERCKVELGNMRKYRIDNKTTLYDIISHKPWTFASNHVNNQELRDFVNGERCEKEYPIYSYLIRMRFSYNSRRFNLIERTKEPFDCLTNVHLPNEVSDKLFRMLKGQDLENIIEARRQQVVEAYASKFDKEIRQKKQTKRTRTNEQVPEDQPN